MMVTVKTTVDIGAMMDSNGMFTLITAGIFSIKSMKIVLFLIVSSGQKKTQSPDMHSISCNGEEIGEISEYHCDF